MKLETSKGATTGFILAAVGLLITGGFSFHNMRRISENDAWIVHTHLVLDELRDVFATLSEAEAGQRGYIITGHEAYRQPYDAAMGSIRKHLANVRSLVVDNSAQLMRLQALQETVRQRLDLLREGIDLREKNGFEAAQNFLLTGKGKSLMDDSRGRLGEMESVERDLLAVREGESRKSYKQSVVTLFASVLLGLALVGIAYGMTGREAATRHRAAEALQRANDELEQRVHDRTADLNATNESLKQSNRELESFASVASHDLQEPLRKIQAFGDRLQTKCAVELGEQGREYLARMQASATRMRSLIDALLSYSRVTTKAQPFVSVELDAIAQDVASDLEDRVLRSGGRIDLSPLPTIEADPLQMRQLLQNLIANGLKFHRPDVPPVVLVGARLLNYNGESANGDNGAIPCCEIVVHDNGIGFEEVYLDRIFELFQRLHGRQEYEGTGMGLAICRKIVERHGGTITAKSAPGEGARFLITLPMRQT